MNQSPSNLNQSDTDKSKDGIRKIQHFDEHLHYATSDTNNGHELTTRVAQGEALVPRSQ